MEIAPGLHRIEMPLGRRVNAVHVFAGPDGAVLFDVGVDGDASANIATYLKTVDIEPQAVRWIVVSHCDVDHFGGLRDARRAFPGAQVLAHALDAPLIVDHARFEAQRARWFRRYGLDESPDVLEWMSSVSASSHIDRAITGAVSLDLGDREVEIVHVPGHTEGHLAVLDRERAAIAVADAVLGAAVRLADGTPAFPPTYRFVDQYVDTIAEIERLGVAVLLPAHEPPKEGGQVREFLASSSEFVSRLDHELHDLFRDRGTVSLGDACTIVGPKVGAWPIEGTTTAMAFPVAGHLERLTARGRLRETTMDDGSIGWSRTA